MFAINPDAKVSVRIVGPSRHRVVIVDDFLADPDYVRKVADNVSYTDAKELVHGFPGERAVVDADTHTLRREVCRLWGHSMETEGGYWPLVISSQHSGVPLEASQRQPHTDPALVALVYLNRLDECVGGTALYRHVGTDTDFIPFEPDARTVEVARSLGYGPQWWSDRANYNALTGRIFFNDAFAVEENRPINQGNSHWELLTLAEMRWNRLVIFDGQIPHSEYTEAGDFVDRRRLVQLLTVPLDGEPSASMSRAESTAA